MLGLEWRNVTLDRRVGATVTLPAARSKFDRYDITSEADKRRDRVAPAVSQLVDS